MFGANLMSMLVHVIPPEAEGDELRRHYRTVEDLAEALRLFVANRPNIDWPRLPILGRTTISIEYEIWFGKAVRWDKTSRASFFWGRVPLDQLVKFFVEFRSMSPDSLHVDLGAPVRSAGSGSSFDNACARLLAKSATAEPKAGAAIIDLGDDSTRSPDDYGGTLRHAVTSNIKLSAHAEQVLSVLLERLDSNSSLAATKISCALVRPVQTVIAGGASALDQVNSVEMLDAVRALDALTANDSFPNAINMSLGTHVGPHNGDSPLEEYIATKLVQKGKRFLVASAGNDGGKGLSATRQLRASEREFLTLRTGSRCTELLVEFWWDDSNGANFALEADIFERLQAGGLSNLGTVSIAAGLVGTLLATAPAGLPPGLISRSLFSAKCRNNLSCSAFALSSKQPHAKPRPLPPIDIRFTLESTANILVNAWIVVAEIKPQTAFIEGGQSGSVMVPASDPAVLSVAGAQSSGHMWDSSSRGPAANYQPGSHGSEVPLMAHLVSLPGAEPGTSYASPRACADAVAALADPHKLANCNDAMDLMCEAYGIVQGALPAWNERSGYYKVVK